MKRGYKIIPEVIPVKTNARKYYGDKGYRATQLSPDINFNLP